MSDEFGLIASDEADVPGDEWEEIDVSDTEADRIARRRDREFDDFRKRLKDADQFKVEQSVFDDATFAAIYKLVQDGYIDAFGGPISTGKEANVYEALGEEGRDVAAKIYRINASNFRHMRDYLEGDPRFEGIGHDKKQVVLAWTQKEFANLSRARQAGVRVPEPIAVERNVLVMELVGLVEDRARRLAEVNVENPQTAYEVVREYMRRLYSAGLVHGDLSEYNMIIHEGELVVIDLGQAVTVHHPNADEFLRRDCTNVAKFFSRQGLETAGDDVYEFVTTADPDPSGAPNDPSEADETDADDAGVNEED
ncbi:serine/threonine-protein kinase Rio1 [Halopelagius longus]|uniref:non-specific serine/threonine protein kinase n=1 Tax=Halopelagius longus TaxID=1236180 RepID=A0A1H1EEH8_9EURY|nr:serine/threonine-protein kinase Rio1 [Halopelagius longus]RDI71724.1 serine protein kinase RIO [Halopelagius longus]SDQ87147.1 RIO kinase 1 [Halopelagius longus]